jgi:hypothetical protein
VGLSGLNVVGPPKNIAEKGGAPRARTRTLVGAMCYLETPAPEIDPPPKTAVLKKLFARKLCSYLAVSKFKFAQKYLKIWLR